jgi:hypothetical protein
MDEKVKNEKKTKKERVKRIQKGPIFMRLL